MLFFDMLQSSENFAISCVVLPISAVLVSVVVPAFRSTIQNFILFLFGGSVGLLTCITFYNRFLADLPNPLNKPWALIGSILVMFFGAVFAGSLSVWIKIRLKESPQSMRWSLPVGQLLVSLLVIRQFLAFGVLGTLGALGMSVTGHFNADLSRVPKLYECGLLVASFSLDFASLLSLIGAVLTTLKPSKISVRIWHAATICYWIFIAGEILIGWSLQLHLTLRYLRVSDLMPYVIGIVAILIAPSLSYYVEVRALSEA
jgi:hypothetical protein